MFPATKKQVELSILGYLPCQLHYSRQEKEIQCCTACTFEVYPQPSIEIWKEHTRVLSKKKAALHNNSSNNTFSEEFHFFSFNTLHGMISPYIVKQSMLRAVS